MNKIYLPMLKKINIENFSLYPNALDFTYDFIEGVNLIVGGNGIGKTTFVNLIKYSLIGLYRKHKDSRRYKENKIVKREQFNEEYFKNRMDKSYSLNEQAKVTVTFYIGNTLFTVTRNLYSIQLEKVLVNENGNVYALTGNIIKQHKYEKLNNEEKREYLQYKYEEKVAKAANLYEFDDLIFFINEILIFGENRKTILWDTDLQEMLSSKYFNDPNLDNKYNDYKMDAKYFDSLSRHKSEDIRAIRMVLEKISTNENENEKGTDTVKKINELKIKMEKEIRKLEIIQNDRKKIEYILKIKYNEKTKHIKEQQEIEISIKEEEKNIYKELWETLHPDYYLFEKYIKNNMSCPLCNKPLEKEVYHRMIHSNDKCVLCGKEIKNINNDNDNIKRYKERLNNKLALIQSIEKDIYNNEVELRSLDSEFNKVNLQVNQTQAKLRDLEYLISTQNDYSQNDSITIKKMMNEILLLEQEKNEFQQKSKKCTDDSNEIAREMDDNRVRITRELSQIFSEFAERFLSVKCELTYDDFDGKGNRYIPIIDRTTRSYAEELSESQSFFIDHSFRMSLLKYFYTAPSFFICETPDSSLDISYEINAANVFLKYLDYPNALIITSNLNNSKFLDHIVEHAPKIKYINLLKIGRPSTIQSYNESLKEITNRIEGIINGKSHNV